MASTSCCSWTATARQFATVCSSTSPQLERRRRGKELPLFQSTIYLQKWPRWMLTPFTARIPIVSTSLCIPCRQDLQLAPICNLFISVMQYSFDWSYLNPLATSWKHFNRLMCPLSSPMNLMACRPFGLIRLTEEDRLPSARHGTAFRCQTRNTFTWAYIITPTTVWYLKLMHLFTTTRVRPSEKGPAPISAITKSFTSFWWTRRRSTWKFN